MLPVSHRRWAAVRVQLQSRVRTDSALPDPEHQPDLALPVRKLSMPKQSPPLQIYGVMSGDTQLLTKQCLNQLGLNCRLQCGPPENQLA